MLEVVAYRYFLSLATHSFNVLQNGARCVDSHLRIISRDFQIFQLQGQVMESILRIQLEFESGLRIGNKLERPIRCE